MSDTNTTTGVPEDLKLERETCSRCGGSGHYSYCQRYGTRCFRCGGKKVTLTKRGAAAMQHLKELRSRRYDEVKVGDTVRMGGVTMGGDPYTVWVTVADITRETQSGRSATNGVWTDWSQEVVVLRGKHCHTDHGSSAPADSKIEVLLSRDEQIATLRAAKAYEGTLTKAGTPRVR